ncbi:hypothetical protein ASE21_17040 [Flavobacterium sp. Root901]|nr:hypothetical protein ASE21_17040 [Flavobacterium sp. Root901]
MIIICKTKSEGMKMNFQSTSSQPDFSDTKAKLVDKKKQSSIVLMIILLLAVFILEIKPNLYLDFICRYYFKQT